LRAISRNFREATSTRLILELVESETLAQHLKGTDRCHWTRR
jgi:hypothetical protein